VNKKSIFYSSDQPNEKPRRRRKRKRRTTRSRSHKRSSSAKHSPKKETSNPNDEQLPVSSTLHIESISEDDDDDDDSIEILGSQLAQMNCQGEQGQCDDSDSMDDALDAEQFDDDIESSFIPPNVQ
jgi:hypothetical protein